LNELLQPYPDLCAASASLHVHGVGAHFLAALAQALGQHARAVTHFEHAIERYQTLGFRAKLVRARVELAELLLPTERARARVLLTAAREEASELTMAPLTAAADRLLAML
jgi:hypothetical protein